MNEEAFAADTVIGIVEAMKLINRIAADRSGVVRDVLVPARPTTHLVERGHSPRKEPL